MSNLSIRYLYDAIYYAEKAANLYRVNRNYDEANSAERTAQQARKEYAALSDALPRMEALSVEAGKSYDRYVTSDRGCCSCHLCAPCSFCTSQTDEQRPMTTLLAGETP